MIALQGLSLLCLFFAAFVVFTEPRRSNTAVFVAVACYIFRAFLTPSTFSAFICGFGVAVLIMLRADQIGDWLEGERERQEVDR